MDVLSGLMVAEHKIWSHCAERTTSTVTVTKIQAPCIYMPVKELLLNNGYLTLRKQSWNVTSSQTSCSWEWYRYSNIPTCQSWLSISRGIRLHWRIHILSDFYVSEWGIYYRFVAHIRVDMFSQHWTNTANSRSRLDTVCRLFEQTYKHHKHNILLFLKLPL